MRVKLAGGGEADLARGEVLRDGRVSARLTTGDTELLAYLVAHAGEDISRERIATEVLRQGASIVSRAIDSAVFRLRTKVEPEPSVPVQLITVQGTGYRWLPATPRRSAIPPARVEVLGRSAVYDAIASALAAGPVCTVVGPPGIGKTSAALAYGRSVARAALVELAGLADAEAVTAAVARALDVPVDDANPHQAVGWALAHHREVLVVLDDADAATDALRELLLGWVTTAPLARWLLTSRSRLDCPGETVVPVAPLDRDTAAALFVARAREVRAGFDPSPDERADIDALVVALDAVPLAIELAATRIRALSAAQMLARLPTPLRLLSRPGTDRQAALRAVIDESWALLPPGDQATFAALSVFLGSFNADDVQRVVGVPADAVERLVARSLVVAGPEGRYRLLGSLRAFAEERLAERPEDEQRLWRSHAAHVTRDADGRRDPLRNLDSASVARRLVDDGRDLRAVVTRFVDTAPELAARAVLMTRAGLMRTSSDRSLDAVALDLAAQFDRDDAPTALRVALLRAAAFTERRAGRYAEASRWIDRCAAVPDPTPTDAARVHGDRAALAVLAGHPDEALRWSDAAVAAAEALDDDTLLGTALSDRAVALKLLARLDDAATDYARALTRLDRAGATLMAAVVRGNLGILEAEQGQLGVARARFEAAAAVQREAGNSRSEAVNLVNLGQLADEDGDPDAARAAFAEALAIMVRTGSRRFEGIARCNLGGALARDGRTAEARVQLDLAQRIAIELDQERDASVVSGELGMLAWIEGDRADALDRFTRALPHANGPRYEALYRAFGAALLALGGGSDEAQVWLAAARDRAAHARDPSLGETLSRMAAIVEVCAGGPAPDLARPLRAAWHLRFADQRWQEARRAAGHRDMLDR